MKVEEYQTSLKSIDESVQEEKASNSAGVSGIEKKTKQDKKEAKPKIATSSLPLKIIEKNNAAHRKAEAEFVRKSSLHTKALAFDYCLKQGQGGRADVVLADGMNKNLLLTNDIKSQIERVELFALQGERWIDQTTQKVIVHTLLNSNEGFSHDKGPFKDVFGGMAVHLVKTQADYVDLEQHFKLDVDYLNPHTKKSIQLLLVGRCAGLVPTIGTE